MQREPSSWTVDFQNKISFFPVLQIHQVHSSWQLKTFLVPCSRGSILVTEENLYLGREDNIVKIMQVEGAKYINA
jgi:hypothetical protein